MNIVQITNLIKDIANSQKFVNSFFNDDPYIKWNTNEIQYGSVLFAIQNSSTKNGVVTYNAVMYYGDRLNEARTNKESIFSDATTILNGIVGVLRTVDDIDITQSTQITYFEQKFTDELAGGYMNLSIEISDVEALCGWEGEIGKISFIKNQSKEQEITANGEYNFTYDHGFTGLENITISVNVPTTIKNQSKEQEITKNGVYSIEPDEEFTGLSRVDLNVNVKTVTEYSELTGIPSINNVTIIGNLSLDDLNIQQKGDYLTAVPSEYVTLSVLEGKRYLTAIPSEYVTETELSDTLNSKGYLTAVPTEYVTETELNSKGYLTAIPAEYVTETELNSKGYLTSVKTINGQSIIGTGNIEIEGGSGDGISDAPADGNKYLRQDNNWVQYLSPDMSGYLTAIPSEYVTESELNTKGYITKIPSDYVTLSVLDSKGYITKIPSDYVTLSVLDSKGYLSTIKTINGQSIIGTGNIEIEGTGVEEAPLDGASYLRASGIWRKYIAPDLSPYLSSIPSNYVTDDKLTSTLDSKGYITSVKTINGQSIIGTGNIEIEGGSSEGISDAPADNRKYLRQNNNWVEHQDPDLSGYLTRIPSDYVTLSVLNSKGYLTRIPSDYITESELAVELDSRRYLTRIPDEYITEDELNITLASKKYLTAIPSEYVTLSVLNSKGYLTSIPAEYVTETELSGKGYVTLSTLNSKGYLTAIPSEYVTETELEAKRYLTAVPSEYVTLTELNLMGYLTSIPAEYVTETELDKKGYLTAVPSEYVTLSTLNSKGYLTAVPSDYLTRLAIEDLINSKGYLTAVPAEYVTLSVLNSKGYLTAVPAEYMTDTEVDVLLKSKNYLTVIPSEYVTETEMNSKGYITSLKTINGQSIIGTGDLVIQEGGDIDLSGYVTETELIAKDYVTESEMNSKGYITSLKTINGQSIIGTGDLVIQSGGSVDLSDYLTKEEATNTYATLSMIGDINSILDQINGVEL